MFRRSRHRVPSLNTTSTADISFMLLILFLVTTSMDVDKGLARRLPPIDADKEEQLTDISRGNVLRLELTSGNEIIADGQKIRNEELKKLVFDFVGTKADREKHVISVDVSRDAGYDAYFNMQNDIVAAYNALRDMRARKLYRRPFEQCSSKQKNELRKYYPQRIAETYQLEEKGEEP